MPTSTRTTAVDTPPSAEPTASRVAREVWLRVRTARLPAGGLGVRGGGPDLRRIAIAVAAVVAVVVGLRVALPQGLPNEILVLGLVFGGLNALPAIGIVLVYRANRIINFAQGEMGAFAASLAFMLMITLGWSWYVAVPLSLLAATAMGGLVEFSLIRRFFNAPRLLMTVATIGIAQLLTGFRLGLPAFFPDIPPNPGSFPSPLDRAAFSLGGAIFRFDDVVILIVVPAITVGVTLYLRGTWAGLGTRAAAENIDRSRLLGIRVRRLSTIVWAIAGLLSGLTAVLKAPVAGFSLFTYSGTGLLVRALAPAAIGGFTNLPLTFAAAVMLGVVEQAFFWNYARGGPLQTLLLVVLLVALLVRSRGYGLFDEEVSSWQAVRDVRRIPRAVRSILDLRLAAIAGAVGGIALLALMPRIASSAQVNLIGLVGVHVIVGLSLIVLTGWTGQVSLGQWAIVGVGAFLAGWATTRHDLDFFAVLALGTVAGGLVSLLLGFPAQRMPGMLFGVTTLAFGLAAESFLFELDWTRGIGRLERPVLFGAWSLDGADAYYVFTMAGVLLALVGTWNLKRYRVADVLLAARDNPRAAESYGVSVTRARRTAFLLSGCLAGYAGVLYAFHQQVVATNRFPAEQGIAVLSMVVIGGLGSISGVVLGALFVRVSQYLLPAWMAFFATGLGLLFVLLVFPGGLGEVVFRLRYRVVGWVARRHGLMLPPQTAAREPEDPLLEEPAKVTAS